MTGSCTIDYVSEVVLTVFQDLGLLSIGHVYAHDAFPAHELWLESLDTPGGPLLVHSFAPEGGFYDLCWPTGQAISGTETMVYDFSAEN